MNDENLKYLKSLLDYPAESDNADYKAAIEFKEDTDFATKLVKHILGFANAGGGYIIIGFKEEIVNKVHVPDPNLNDIIVGSYEVTRLSQYVSVFLSDQDKVEFKIYKFTFGNKIYPIISIASFRKRPFFCMRNYISKANGEQILKAGLIYIRTKDAKTVEIAGPAEWDRLMDACIEARRGDFLESMKSVLDSYISPKKIEKEMEVRLQGVEAPAPKEMTVDWIEKEREKAKKLLNKAGFQGSFEVILETFALGLNLSQKQLLEIAKKSECHNTGWPIGVVMTKPEFRPKVTSGGIEATLMDRTTEGFDYWTIKRNGNFYFIRELQEDSSGKTPQDRKVFWWDLQIYRIAEAILYCSNLCRELKIDVKKHVRITIIYQGLKERTLSSCEGEWHVSPSVCHEDEVRTEIEMVPDALSPRIKDIVYDIAKELFVYFEFFTPSRGAVDRLVDKFFNSRV